MTYLQIKGRDVWHFHPKCQHYRRINGLIGRSRDRFVALPSKPLSGELCNECRAKAR